MLSEGQLVQREPVERLGAPTDPVRLASELGRGWRAGYVGPGQFDRLLGLGRSWGAEMFTGEPVSHMIVVDGQGGEGHIHVRDPWDGTAGELERGEFLHYWTGRAVFQVPAGHHAE